MIKIFTAFLIILSFSSNAQNYLTNAQVYNFQPGDVFQWCEWEVPLSSPWSPHWTTYKRDSLISRTNLNDTIVYTWAKQTISIPPQVTPFNQISITNSSDTTVIKGLNSPAYYPNQTQLSCFTIKDSVIFNNQFDVNMWVKMYQLITDSNGMGVCFESIAERGILYERLGGPAYLRYNEPGQLEQHKDLTYYKLASGETYGNLITGITDEKNFKKVRFYPNPAVNQLNFTGFFFKELNVYDISGREVIRLQGEEQSLEISTLAPGRYFINSDQGYIGTFEKINR